MSGHKHLHEGAPRHWLHSGLNLESIGLRSGMTFMDIGCGYGFFTIPASSIVGETGRVYAVDVDAISIDQLKRDAANKGLKNIRVEVGPAEDTVFCNACADIVFYNTVLHDFRDPAKVLSNAKTMIKPTGKLVNVDWKKKPTEFGPPQSIRFSEEHAVSLIEQADFIIKSVEDLENDFYIVTAKPRPSR